MRRRYIIQFAVALSVVIVAIACLATPGICQLTTQGAGQKTPQVNTPGTSGSAPSGTGQGVSGGQPMNAPSAAAPAKLPSMATAKPTVSPTMSATSIPATAAPTKAVVTSTAKATPSPRASPVSSSVAAPRGTAVEQGRTSVSGGGVSGGYVLQVSNYAIVTQTINPGGLINGYVEFQNTGSNVINDALISLALVPVDRPSTIVATRDQTLSNLNIQPGETKRVDFSINAPGDVTAGNYNVQATVKANNQDIKSFTSSVRVA